MQNKRRVKNAYLFLGEGKKDNGGGMTMKLSMKNEHLYLHRAFQVVWNQIRNIPTNSCFGVAILLAIMHLLNPKKFELLQRNNKIEDFMSVDKIIKVYERMNLQVNKVDASQFEHVYEDFLKAENIDLVIYCEEFFHKLIFDTRVDDSGNVLRVNNEVICLWLIQNIMML